MLEAVNNDTKESSTIGKYSVNFDENTVTETEFDKSLLKRMFSDEETESVPSVSVPSNSDEEIYDDEDFWNSILNGY